MGLQGRRVRRFGAAGAVVVTTAFVAAGGAGQAPGRAGHSAATASAAGSRAGAIPPGFIAGGSGTAFRAGVVLVGFRPGVSPGRRLALERAVGARGARRLGPAVRGRGAGGAAHVAGEPVPLALTVSRGAVLTAVRRLRGDPAVAYAEPDYLMQASATPNDPSFGLQWAANNTGQSIPTQNSEEVLGASANGTPGADDRALAAWGVSTGTRSIVIGETDTGVNYNHADLGANIWSNPGGIGGCAAGTRGYNVLTSTCEPMDNDTVYGGHGTHVAGIMGAVGNNSIGVAGMNWQTTILPVKWLDSSASGSTSGLIAALQWLLAAKQAGVNLRVVNDSATFVGTAYSQALSDEIDTLGANNVLFVTAAGNTGANNDEEAVRRYPCGYDRASEICVTATDNNDKLPSWANYGPHTVDLAAPGVSIYSTLRNGGYGYLSGGSMASPQVAGAAALILSVAPTLSATALKADILEHVDPLPSLAGKVITGGRLNVCRALPGCITPPPPTTFGKSNVGGSSDSFLADRKRVSRYALPTAGALTKLSVYLAPTGVAGQQVLKGVVYADSGGSPGALLGTSEELTFKSTQVAGWYDLKFALPLKLSAANYWIGAITGATSSVAGFRYDSVTGSRDYNPNTYTSGPTNPFGAFTSDSEQASLYATYTATTLTAPPSNTLPPTIIGTAQQGQTLTEVHGAWTNSPTSYAYQWLRCDSSGNSCTPIPSATSQAYVPVSGDVGHTLRVKETASNEGGAGLPATSLATAVVVAVSPPANTVPPTITGTAQQGQTLTEAHGTWTGSPTSYAYRWLECDSLGNTCTPIPAATNQTYVPVSGDVGHTLRVQETASNEGGAGVPATSLATAAVLAVSPPSSIVPPTITGTAQQGQTLTEVHGTWTGSPTSYAYQWLQCDSLGNTCTPITAATAQTYVPVSGDVGHTLRVQETASNEGGAGLPATSLATAVVAVSPPSSILPPTITGTAQQGQTLTEAHGAWTNSPTSYAYQWLRCDSSGNACVGIAVATSQTYVPVSGDVGRTLRVQETASNEGGSGVPSTSLATAVVLTVSPPANTLPPTITGTAQQGQTLTELHGTWTGSPTSYAYQWLQCDSLGNTCTPIASATSQTYVPVSGDVGHALRVQETASNEGGAGLPATSLPTAVVLTVSPPANTLPPTITGTPQQGQTLTEAHGAWTGSPTSYAYQWLQCDSLGNTCTPIASATGQKYVPVSGDVGHTLRVQETASNEGGAGLPATSLATAVVQQAPTTFGKTTIGGSPDNFLAARKRVSRYALTSAGTVTKLSIYLAPAAVSGQQVLKGLVYADSGGSPSALLGTSEELTFKSTQAAGWYDLHFAVPLKLSAANYWIGVITGANNNVAGFRYDSVPGSRDYNANTYTSGPSNPFGPFNTDSEQMSLYATYTLDTTPPTQPQGLTATAVGSAQVNLSWTPSTDDVGVAGYTVRRNGAVIASTTGTGTSYSDHGLSPASTYTYTVDAYDAAGNHSAQSEPASATTASSSSVQHYEYVFPSNAIDVYAMDEGQKLIKTITLPTAATDIRGAVASPATHMLYVSYGGDGGVNGGGSILAYNLVSETTAWTHAYPEGVDSMAITPDGKTIYLPVGEASSSSTWEVLEASSGAMLTTVQGGKAPHNTIVSLNGEHVYMGGREASFLTVANTSTNQVVKEIGPLLPGGVRPFTINGKETLAFTTATGYLGFQVSSITTGQVLYTVPISGPFPYTAGQPGPSSPSHGISLSPDEKELWVMDQPNDYVHVFDVTGLPASAPKQIADIKLTRPMTGSQVGCTYDCLREGWLQHSLDDRFVYVGDSGDVIDTATLQSVANLEPLYNSRVYLEIDWSNGLPLATSSRSGVGYVTN